MEDTESPKYTSDSYIPFPSERDREINCRLTDDRNVNRQQTSSSSRRSNRNVFSNFDHIPWKTSIYSCGVIGLHEEINDFFEKMHPTEKEKEIRLRVVEHITKTVHSLWPLAKVEVFGSFRTGLYLPSSDIDMVIIGEWVALPLSTLSQALIQNGVSEEDINIISNATVPIVRMKHTPSSIKVDISFNKTNGVQSAKLVKKWMKKYPPLPKLVLVLKQFLVHRGLNEVYNGGMSSYCLTLLIVSLLQGYHKPKTDPPSNLGVILLEFFEHYGVNFNYEKVSVHFEGEASGKYQPKYKGGYLLCVEDPLLKGNDIAKGTYMMPQLKEAFENAFFVLHTALLDSASQKRPLNSYLSLIVTVDDKVWEDRQWILNNYSIILKKLSDLIPEERVGQDTYSSNNKKNLKKKQYRGCS